MNALRKSNARNIQTQSQMVDSGKTEGKSTTTRTWALEENSIQLCQHHTMTKIQLKTKYAIILANHISQSSLLFNIHKMKTVHLIFVITCRSTQAYSSILSSTQKKNSSCLLSVLYIKRKLKRTQIHDIKLLSVTNRN